MKVIALFNVDDETLDEIEGGSVSNALAWCSDSGMYLETYEEVDDNFGFEDLSRAIPAVFPNTCKTDFCTGGAAR